MLYDAFISHASEDKQDFVRGLAEALRKDNVAVWYDEFSLKTGSSLRRSIDHGLSKSRFGIVVLSKAFIGKKWPEWELDGLVQRQNHSSDSVILPVWLGLTYQEVLDFSPPLADKFAIQAEKGLEYVVSELLKVIHPQGSSLVVARNRLIESSYEPPVVTDDWWHQAIEYCGSNYFEGFFRRGRWGFPLTPTGTTSLEKGERIARAALQLNWQRLVPQNRISQITKPAIIHDFINSTPGLRQICLEYPEYLAYFAPQLTIRGHGGDFERAFDNWLANSRQEKMIAIGCSVNGGIDQTTNGMVPTCPLEIALHDSSFGNYKPDVVASFFIHGCNNRPDNAVYENIDYLLWLLSDASAWVPEKLHILLADSLMRAGNWMWKSEKRRDFMLPLYKRFSDYNSFKELEIFKAYSDFQSTATTGSFYKALIEAEASNNLKLTSKIHDDIESRFACQSALKIDPPSASKIDPPQRLVFV